MTINNYASLGIRWMVLTCGLLLSPLAGASFIGDTITVQIGVAGTGQSVLVGPGVEISTGAVNIDIGDNTITVDFADVFLDSIFFTDINDVIASAVGGSEYSLTSLTVTHSTHAITAAVENNTPPGGFVITVNSRVPEPATLVLMGLGLAGVGFARKRTGYRH